MIEIANEIYKQLEQKSKEELKEQSTIINSYDLFLIITAYNFLCEKEEK